MSTDFNLELASILDGKASIEHQIDIHVNDLFGVKETDQVSLADVLDGLRYVMNYRIKGGRLPNLEPDLMKRLCEGLLLNMSDTEGGLLKKKMTPEAEEAFILFGEFLEEVEEFRQAVGQKNVSDLANAMKLHRRCRNDASPEVKQAVVAVIYMLTEWFPQFSDWRELVKREEQNDVEKVIKDLSASFKKAKMPSRKGVPLPPPSLYFDRDVTRCVKMFRTSLTDGLSSTNISPLLEHYGPNKLPDPPKPSVLKMLLHQLTDFMVLILLAATIVTGAEKDFKGMSVLLAVIILNTIIGFTQEYKANKALEALTKLAVPQAQVIRDGQKVVIDSSQLVPGDIVILEEGDSVPADVRIVECSQFEVIESILTGESLPVSKNTKKIWTRTRSLPLGDCKGNAFMSTMVAKGRAKGLVVRTGNNTEIGKISAAITSSPNMQTPIQRKLSRLGIWLVVLAIILCVLVVVIGLIYKRNSKDMISVGMSLAVSVIPEGLVAVTTVTMAIGVRRMAARNAIVRTLPAVETLGSVTVICSDKTGTLTEGKMGPSELWSADDSLYSFTKPTVLDPNEGEIEFLSPEYRQRVSKLGRSSTPKVSKTLIKKIDDDNNNELPIKPQPVTRELNDAPAHMVAALMISSLCNNAAVVKSKSEEESKNSWKGIGDPTEIALILAAQKGGFSKEFWEKKQGFTKIREQPFDSERKLMSVVYKFDYSNLPANLNQTNKYIVMAKGAPEELLQKCTSRLPVSNFSKSPITFEQIIGEKEGTQNVPLSDDFVDKVSEESSRMASNGLRVLGLALKTVSVADESLEASSLEEIIVVTDDNESVVESTLNPAFAENEFTFVGLIGLIDPPRAGVADSVQKCKDAGIRVIMITGDHIATATAIATDIGIFEPGVSGMNRAIRGVDLDLLSDDAIAALEPFPNVFARVSPNNKLKIVKALQDLGNSVAMTGDGVNDAPAIKAANIGVAMGISGTEITKQAADIILANDDFSTIVSAVEIGRQVFDNILKFIVYLLSCNGAEIIVFLLSASINSDLPFTTIMILWANIIADVPPAMSLGVEPGEKDIMRRRPRNPKAGVLDKVAIVTLTTQSFVMALSSFGIYQIALKIEDKRLEDARSLAFATLTTLQLLQGFLSRTLNISVFKMGFFGNKWMIGSVLGSFIAMLIGVYVPAIEFTNSLPSLFEVIRDWLELTPVSGFGWLKIIICCMVLILTSEFTKWYGRHVRNSAVRANQQKLKKVETEDEESK
ncbi:7733_t:CDS:10 [Ambispora gerdemannii]|uniref:Sodium/potassium exporting P-type ATPase 1 n=1 Tax=Ambispora gerdemannii TaxID=144530 RepID=A0A9N9AIR8_9GLOM|nr:7733_t:CDS:10 [Ambispora gerdemannii]